MPYLRCSRRYRLSYLLPTSRTNENKRRQLLEPSQSFTAGMPVELHSSQLRSIAGMPEVKTGMTDVAGHFCSHIGTAAVPAAMSQIYRRRWEPGFNGSTESHSLFPFLPIPYPFTSHSPYSNVLATWSRPFWIEFLSHVFFRRDIRCFYPCSCLE